MQLAKSTYYQPSRAKDNRALMQRLKELAQVRPRFGYRRLYVLLRREGWQVNHKRVHRLYVQQGLNLPQKKKKKLVAQARCVPEKTLQPNERWSMDFVSDALMDGRKLRILTLIDCHSKESLAI